MGTELYAETEKLRTTRMAHGLLIALVVAVVGLTALTSLVHVVIAGQATAQEPGVVAVPAALTPYFAVVAGVLVVVTEFRFGTITSTYLAVPRRGRVVFAKLVIGLLLGISYGLIAVLSSMATAGVLRAAVPGAQVFPLGPDTLQAWAGTVQASGLYAAVGVAIGALVHSQLAAVLLAVLGLIGDQSLFGRIVPAHLLPTGAAHVLEGFTAYPNWLGVLVLLAYVVVISGIAMVVSIPRDRT
jgi:ABC-2 type transport system permease protein